MPRTLFTPVGTAVVFGLVTLPAWAQETANGTAADAVTLTPMTITEQTAATKTETPFIETPQAISVVTREQMIEQGAQTVQQAARYSPGIFTNQIGASKRYDYMVMRGFSDGSIDNIYLDGLKLMGDSATYSSLQVDPYFLERMEIVKGPASVLYGRASPGGLVALTSKKPLFTPYHQIEATVGSNDRHGVGFDFSGPLGEEQRMAYRLTGLIDRSDTQFDHVEQERYALAPSFTTDLDEATTLTLMAYLQKDPEGGYHGGVPAEGTLYSRNGRYISRHYFDGEPDYDKFEREQQMVGYRLEHTFNDTWSARQSFRYLHSDVELDQVYGYGWASATALNRYYSGADERLEAYAVDNQLQADFATGAFTHTMLFGLDYQHRRADVDWYSGTFPALDAFVPDYGAEPIAMDAPTLQNRQLEQTGVYMQDQIVFDKWRFTLGGRQDWVNLSTTNRQTDASTRGNDEQFSGRAGVLYLFDNGFAPYLSYSESFNPNSYADESGKLLEPTEGRQYEAGLKFEPPGSSDQYTLALFHIDQENLATKRPNEPFYRSVGKIRSQGVELEARTQLTTSLRLLASYTYTDIIYKKSSDGTEGNTPNFAPRHMASLWGSYAADSGPLTGLDLGLGVRYVADLWADKENTRKVPDYTLVDTSLRYDLGQLGLDGMETRLNVNNLFDKDYVAACSDLNYCYFGEERTVSATLSYQF